MDYKTILFHSLGVSSALPSVDRPYGRQLLFMCKACLPSSHHPLTKIYFKSYPAMVREQVRHLQPDQARIHPLSMFSLVWSSLMVLVQMARMILAPLRLFYVINNISSPSLHGLDYLMLILQITCLVDIQVKLNTGLLNKHDADIVLNRKKVVRAYSTGWLPFDVLNSSPLGFLVQLGVPSGPVQLLVHSLPLLILIRIEYVFHQLTILLEIIFRSYAMTTLLVRHFIVFVFLVHWCACANYLVTIIRYYWTGVETVDYNQLLNLDETPLSQVTLARRYWRSLFVVLTTFLGTGFSMYKVARPDEIVLSVVIILGSTVFMVYTVVMFLDMYMTKSHASTKYNEIIDELKNYMSSKQLPPELKKRLLKFYEYKYQKHHFREECIFDDLSERLRQETRLDMRRKLVENVELFAGLPKSVVGSILACMHRSIYLPNDLVINAGEIGNSMFFIACGTVAVYTSKGAEVQHLEDGSHFGEASLLMNDMRRVVTVVALEITELYRIDRSDFRKYVATCDILYDRIKVLATKRMADLVQVEEAHRKSKETQSSTRI